MVRLKVWMKVQAIGSQCTEQDQDLVSGPESQLHKSKTR